MAEPLPYVPVRDTTTMKAYKNHNKDYPQKAKGISFSAFLLSIFIYISIFYIFDLSPSSLCSTTKFWFLISNTLILIIFADYGAFSSSKQGQDYPYYDEYNMVQEVAPQKNKFNIIPDNSRMYSSKLQGGDLYKEFTLRSDSTVLTVQEVVEKSEEEKEVSQKSEIMPENKLDIVIIKSVPEKPRDSSIEETVLIETALEEVHAEDENEKTLTAICCSEGTDHKHEESCTVEENNEFSSMTDEELNRRVEEFIQKFNRQIRLQRTENFG